MNNSDKDNNILIAIWIVTVVISIGSGILAWNWVEPESFFGAIWFLIFWGIFSTIGHFVAAGIITVIMGNK